MTAATTRPLWDERSMDSFSKVIGLYQTLLRRTIEHFFPEVRIEPIGDRSVIRFRRGPAGSNYRIGEDEFGLGVEIEWLRSMYLVQPGSPVRFTAAERNLIHVILRTMDLRFRSLYDPVAAGREDILAYPVEDLVIARYLDTPGSDRIPVGLEAAAPQRPFHLRKPPGLDRHPPPRRRPRPGLSASREPSRRPPLPRPPDLPQEHSPHL